MKWSFELALLLSIVNLFAEAWQGILPTTSPFLARRSCVRFCEPSCGLVSTPRRIAAPSTFSHGLCANHASLTPVVNDEAVHPIDVSLEAWKTAAELVESGKKSVAVSFPAADSRVVASVAEMMDSLSSKHGLVSKEDQLDWAVAADETVLSVVFEGSAAHPEPALEARTANLAKLRMQRWVKRVIIGMKVCPFTQSVEWAATGLGAVGIEPGPISYPTSGNKRLLHVMCDLWTDIAQMLATPPTEHSTTLLLLPKFAPDDWQRFQLASHVVVKSLTTLGVDELASVVFFHPFYVRDSVEPVHEPIHGHLPPGQMLRSMLLVYYDLDEISEMDATLHQNDYSRRAPFPMINILRSEQVQLAEQLTAGTKVYCANARKMAQSDAMDLARKLAADMAARE